MIKMEKLKALFIVGYIASGKSTYTNSIQEDDDLIIELGSVVRYLTKTEKRVFDNDLDDAIYEYCRDLIGESIDQISRVIFVAPRSPKLMERLMGMIGRENCEIRFMFVPFSIREKRFIESKRDKDNNISYLEALRKDASIGMEDLIDNLMQGRYGKYTSIHNF